MSTPENMRVLIVEDEVLIAKDLERRLLKHGYGVVGIVDSGEEAVRVSETENPDLIIMDIWLSGEMDGIDAAYQIKEKLDLPVVFLTAFADEKTLERAHITEPFGYIVKPIDDRELHTNIRIAIYRHKTEKMLREREQWFKTVLKNIADAVIATDTNGNVTFMNTAAELITGIVREPGQRLDITEIFDILDEEKRPFKNNPVNLVMKYQKPLLSDSAVLVNNRGEEIFIAYSASPLTDGTGKKLGVVLGIRDVTRQRHVEKSLRYAQIRLQGRVDEKLGVLSSAHMQLEQERKLRVRLEQRLKLLESSPNLLKPRIG